MDYLAEINEIKATITRLEAQLESATVEERIAIRNQITALETTRSNYVQLLPPQNAQAGNSHSMKIIDSALGMHLKYGYIHS